MKKFIFKLEPVLIQRQRREELAQKDFAEALQAVQEVKEKIVNKQTEIDGSFSLPAYEEGESRQIDVNRLIENRRFVEHMYLEIDGLYNELNEKERVAAHKQHFLLMAAQEREAMSKFKEKKKQSYLKEVLVEEQKLLDEIGVQMSMKKEVW